MVQLRRSSRRRNTAAVEPEPTSNPVPIATPKKSSRSTKSKKTKESEMVVASTPTKKAKPKFSPRVTRSARKQRQETAKTTVKEKEEEIDPIEEEKESKNDESSGESSDDEVEDSDDEEEAEEESLDTNDENVRGSRKKTASVNEAESVEEEEESDDNENEDRESDEESSLDEDEEINQNKVFSDENAEWLKPKKKQNLLSSDDEGEDEDDEEDVMQNDEYNSKDSDASNDDDDEVSVSTSSTASSLLSIERESKLLDRQIAREKAEGEAEYQHMISTQTSVYQLPTAEEIESEMDGTRVMNPGELRDRIQSILDVLANFKQAKMPNMSRSDYTERLSSDMAELFGYLPELVDYFLSMLGPHETLQFLESSDTPRPVVLRTNTLKTRRKDLAQALIKRGVNLDPLSDWSKVGLKIYESPVPLGATPEYLAGYYMLQSAASMCPVLALSPGTNQRVLDMSAAPGGKTSYIAQLMKNTGMILANDLKPERQKATIANMHRLGVKNAVVCCNDGRKMGKLYPNSFDRILLDAPCSGLGVISRDPSVKVQRTIADVLRTSHLQKELLLSAVDALNTKKNGGIMVYSTCSVSIAENEEVVEYLLRKRHVKLLDAGLDFGKPGFTRYQQKRFHPSLALTRRFYPHVHNMDGFYVCKIQKLRHGEKKDDKHQSKEMEEVPEEVDEKDTNMEKEATNDGNMPKSSNKGKNNKDKKAVEKSLKNKGKQQKQLLRTKKGRKKRKRTEEEVKALDKAMKKGKQNVSVPPSFQQKHGINDNISNGSKKKKKKSSTNAKVTKPRRKKV